MLLSTLDSFLVCIESILMPRVVIDFVCFSKGKGKDVKRYLFACFGSLQMMEYLDGG